MVNAVAGAVQQTKITAEFFHALARAFVVGALPRSPMLFDYGAGLPDFIDRFEPASVLPYLADVARIERAWIEAYHSAEDTPDRPCRVRGDRSDLLPDVSLVLHPSVRIASSRFPALTIWRMNIEDGIPTQVDLAACGEDALIVRPEAEVEVRSIPPGSADFIRALASGGSVLAALKQALGRNPDFDLAANLTDLIQVGAVIGFRTERESLKP